MSKLYEKVTLLVSRSFSHGGDGLEKGGLVFFHSINEYNAMSMKHGWESGGKSYHQSWCVRPVEMEALVCQTDFTHFCDGGNLTQDKVFFSGNKVPEVNSIGGW
jgi:hypothetical protein